MHAPIVACVVLLVVLAQPRPAWAAGGGSVGGVGGGGGYSFDPDSATKAERAAQRAHASGRKNLEKATDSLAEARTQTDPGDRAKLEKKARKEFERAVENLERAVKKMPGLYAAHSDLGFALRSLGRYDEALAAYGEALQLEPGYAPAIEYRGEAYLELGQLDAAARAYQALAHSSPELAAQLLDAMQRWVERKRSDPGDIEPGTIESFGGWVERRSAAQARGEGASLW